MSQKLDLYLPPRMAWHGIISGNPVSQFEHSGGIEAVEVEAYRKHRIEGWTLRRSNGDLVLAVSERTSANPYGFVVLMPGMTTMLPSTGRKKDYKWLTPKAKTINVSADIASIAEEIRVSWIDAFNFVEEINEGKNVVRPGLRPPQLGAIYASLAHWTVTQEVGTVVMPTGTGKTETMLALLVRERPKNLLVVVPTAALRDQIANKFLTLGVLQQFEVVNRLAQLPVVGRMEHQFDNINEANIFLKSCNVVVATMAAIGGCSVEVQSALARTCSHLFIDEAHHAPASTWNEFRERVCQENKPVLQFTATPFRRDGKHVGGKSIFTYPLKKAQEEGYFTRITFISIWEYNRERSDEVIAAHAINTLKTNLKNGFDHLLMARADNIDRAKNIHEIYCRLAPELSPLIVHSRQKEKERVKAINSLQSRQSRVVVCVDMLGEGFDLPELKVAALHDIHKSLAITIQFAGRFTRTATDLGEATIIANAADADVEEALEDLYSKDSDWNHVLRRLSEGATSKQRQRSDFIEGFQTILQKISLYNIYPKMSAVVYKTHCEDWTPNTIQELMKNTEFLVEPTINPKEKALLFITREQTPVVWGETKSVQNVIHDMYLAYWDESQHLLFINSTNNKSLHLDLAQSLAGDDVELIRGEQVYRALFGINRLIISNLGLLHLLSRSVQFSMHVGSDVKHGLTQASVSHRKKSNLFSRGFENGETVTIGASYKGRVWAHQIASGISEWVAWCQRVGAKLLDGSISTDKILEHAIIPEIISERPEMIPLSIDWSPYFLERSEETVFVELDNKSIPFYLADLNISSFTDNGPLLFHVSIDGTQAEYEIVFKSDRVEFVPITELVVYVSVSGKRDTLSNWFQVEPPIVTFQDTSKLEYNEIFHPKSEWQPYDFSKLLGFEWLGVNLKKESQYEKYPEFRRLDLQKDSIQYYVIKQLLAADDGHEYDIIFDDDDTGEIADIVALKVAGENLIVHLFHCKYSQSELPGTRLEDFYAVCGQAQKSVYWRSKVKQLFQHLELRELKRLESYNVSRFERGDLTLLDELRRQSRFLMPLFHIYVVQPGLNIERVDGGILDLLGATELYLKETFDIPLTVIGYRKIDN